MHCPFISLSVCFNIKNTSDLLARKVPPGCCAVPGSVWLTVSALEQQPAESFSFTRKCLVFYSLQCLDDTIKISKNKGFSMLLCDVIRESDT